VKRRAPAITGRSPHDHRPFTHRLVGGWFAWRVEASRLAAIPLFSTLSPSELEPIASVAQELEVGAGAVVATQGDFGHAVYAIEAGTAEVLCSDQVIGTLRAGDIFGEIAVLAGGRRSATVRAVSSMQLIMLFSRDLWQIEKNHPQIAATLRTSIEQRLAAHAP
jgi:CRP-like cAMP-binding protein